jgi:16S rRNA (guanine527-N7)-methyltransferase
MANEDVSSVGVLLNKLLIEAGSPALSVHEGACFEAYISLFVRWNTRTNLSSVREPEAILSRHFVESIVCARLLPDGIATLLDFGSGGGLPGIPIAICRPGIVVTLAESQVKKSAFLREAVRRLGISATVSAGRAESLASGFDCVTLRAVDKMADAVRSAAKLVNAGGWLALMTTHDNAHHLESAAGAGYEWRDAVLLPGSRDRILLLGQRTA